MKTQREAQEAKMYRYCWGKKAVSMFPKLDLAHTISNLDTDYPEGFISQMRPGCPWFVVDQETGKVVRTSLSTPAPVYV